MLSYNHSAKHIHRPVPCAHYDIYGMEAWLEAMAMEGKILSSDGFLMGFADFELSAPAKIKYRLQAAKTPRSLLDENRPEEEEIHFSETMGWEYVARYKEFHIYRSTDPTAPELNTDPVVQALTLKNLSKRLPNHLFSIVFWLAVYPIIFFDEGIVRASIATGSAFALFSLFMLVWIVIGELRAILHIRRIRKRLEYGSHPERKVITRSSLVMRSIFAAAAILWIAIGISMFIRVGNAENPLSDYEGDPPFATLVELYPVDSQVERTNLMDLYDNYEYLSDPLIAPESIIWREMADIILPDGSRREAALTLYYHEMSCEMLAKIVAWEFSRDAKSSKFYGELTLPDMGTDYALAYADHGSSIILRHGNKVIMASLLQYGVEDAIPMEICAKVLADSIK